MKVKRTFILEKNFYEHSNFIPIIVVFVLISTLCLTEMDGQTFFRMNADFSIREIIVFEGKDSNRTFLTRGILDYDKNKQQVVYDVTFPNHEKWILQDSVFYKLQNDTITKRYAVPYAMQMLSFDLILNEYSYDFLMKKMGCEIVDVREENNSVFKKWKYPQIQKVNFFKNIITREQDGITTAIVFIDNNNTISSRQFFKEYKTVDGLKIPHLIEQYIYTDSTTYVKKLLLDEVSLNSMERSSVFRNDLDFLPLRQGADKGNIRRRSGLSEK